MAAIDKTYVNSYEEWKEVTEYMKNAKFKCPNGMTLYGRGSLYYPDMSREDVEKWITEAGGDIPVMNTSSELDYFLIKECPVELVQERLKDVYGEEEYNSIKNGTSRYDTFVREPGGKHLGLIEKPAWNRIIKNFNSRLRKVVRHGYRVQVDVPDGYTWYNEEYDCWLMPYELGWSSGNTAHTDCMTLKSLRRKIMKWNLPVGSVVNFWGYWCGESGKFIVKK